METSNVHSLLIILCDIVYGKLIIMSLILLFSFEIVEDCSTVWIVTELNRAASEKEAWEILECATSLIGNGGECQKIHFICTKSDQIDSDSED